MKLSDKLLSVANWLESAENDLLISANNEQLEIVASALIFASEALKNASDEVNETEETSVLTPEALDEMAAVAAAFDESDDELLKKQASVLDEILLTLAAPRDALNKMKIAEEKKIDELKKKYKDVKKEIDENIGTKEAEEALNKSPTYREVHPLEQPLSTRTCPDHQTQLHRIGEDQWRCQLDGRVYDWKNGFTDLKGVKHPGGGIEYQIPLSWDVGRTIFDTDTSTRQDRLGMK